MTGVEYPVPQVDAVIDLISRIKAAFPNVPAGRVIGHSDIGVTEPKNRPPTKLGRKSTDPGSAFPWERVEALGLSFQIAPGTVRPGIYGGFFQQVPGGKIIRGDNDAGQRYGGQVRTGISNAVRELQQDLEQVGYLCRPIDGNYGLITASAVQMFQQHIFSGSRRRGPDPWNSGDGSLDLTTAELIKRVLGEVVPPNVA
jgi:N-acetyl-anhydromuramyl-L-alanine amidase AmpD